MKGEKSTISEEGFGDLKWYEQAKITGEIGEIKTIEYLEKLGFKILGRGIGKNPFDIIAKRRMNKFFIEVKTGSSSMSVNKVSRLIDHSIKNGGRPLLAFVSEEEINIFKDANLDNTVSIEDLIKHIKGEIVEEVVIRLQGGKTIRWTSV